MRRNPVVWAGCAFLLLVPGILAGAAEPPFRAGAAEVDITPTTFPVIVSGGFLESQADQARDRLMSRALVLDDGRTKIALAVVDNLMMPQPLLDEAKQVASRATGIPVQQMLISATHAHSAPSVMGALGSRADPAYAAGLPSQIARSIALADEHLQPARVGWTVTKAYAFNHCRRWIFRPDRVGTDPFGQVTIRAMMHPGHESVNHVGPAGPADPDLSLLAVQTADGKPLAVLANLAMHYKGSAPVSADFCGRFGAALAGQIGAEAGPVPFVGIMSQGTSGDSMWMDYARPRREPGLDGYTQAVAEEAAKAYRQIVFHPTATLAMAERTLRLRRRVPDEARLAWARQLAAPLESRVPRNQQEVYALEAIYLDAEPEVDVKLQAVRIGELGIAAFPNEVYGLTGLKVKLQSPLAPTFNVELANGAQGYIPPSEQHALGGYTTWPARTAGLEVQAEPKIVETLLELLEQVAGRPRVRREVPADEYVQAVLQSQPRALWRMDEWSGQTLQDATGRGHAAQLEPGFALYLPGRSPADLEFAEQTPNRAVHFAGGRMTAAVGVLGDRYSIEMWFWNGLPCDARQRTGDLCAVAGGGDEAAGGETLAISGGAEGGVLVYSDGRGLSQAGEFSLPLRTWHHVVLVRDGRRRAIYLNGREKPEIACASDAPAVAAPRLFFAARPEAAATLEGKLDDVAVYDRALEPAEIAAHWAAAGLASPRPAVRPRTAARYPNRPESPADLERYAAVLRASAPYLWWTLHELTEGRCPDAGGHGRTGTVREGATARLPGSDTANFRGGRIQASAAGLADEYSVECWIWNEQPIDARPVTGYFFSRGPDGVSSAPGDHLGIGGTAAAPGRLIVFNGNERHELLTGHTLLPLRSWNHVVLTRQGSRVRVVLNGQREAEIDAELKATYGAERHELVVGARNDNFAPFVGRIDQVAVYDRALQPEEIAAHWTAGGLTE